MTYNVSSGTLSLYTTTITTINCSLVLHRAVELSLKNLVFRFFSWKKLVHFEVLLVFKSQKT